MSAQKRSSQEAFEWLLENGSDSLVEFRAAASHEEGVRRSNPVQSVTFTGKESKSQVIEEPPRIRNQADVERLVAKVRLSAALQTERIQAVVDGAALAAEQVQDKRLDLLEKDPEVTFDDVVFDLLWSLCLQGVGKALVPIFESIGRELVQVAAWYGHNPRSLIGSSLAVLGRLAGQEFGSDWKSLQVNPEQMIRYNEYVREALTDIVGEKTGEKGREALMTVAEFKRKVPKVNLEPTDTPSVTMLQAAQTYAANQRAIITLHHTGFETILRSNPDPYTLADLATVVRREPLVDDTMAIRDRHKILFEAVIWTLIFGFDQNTHITAQSGLSGYGQIKLPGVQTPLLNYWRRRFARAIEKWLNSLNASEPAGRYAVQQKTGIDLRSFGFQDRDSFDATGKFSQAETGTQESTVFRFFVTLVNDMRSLQQQEAGTGGYEVKTTAVAKK